MTPERWKQVDQILEQALELHRDSRAAFLDQVCADDAELRQEVESLLAHDVDESFVNDQSVEEATMLLISGSGAAPQSIGRYRIVRSLGAGGMGQVFLARDEQLKRPVAVKFLSGYDSAAVDRVKRFRREALAASALNHPNILTIYEIGEDAGHNFIATEFVDGQTLQEVIRKGPVPIEQITEIAIQIAGALAAAHAAGIVHRDIKPANIMVRADGLLKVLDFGVAKYNEADISVSAQSQIETAAGTVIGTAAYMSPEQARGLPLDQRTDLWSAGAILYELTTGVRPFQGDTALDTMAAVIEKAAPPFLVYAIDAPQSLERIVFKALQKDREERYQNASELLADLKQLGRSLDAGDLHPSNVAPAPLPRKREVTSIAVLPFTNMSGDPENEYFCDGLSEELLNALTRVENLKVAARTSAFSFKSKQATASGIARALNVSSVLEGSVRKSGNKLRITVQLINAADGYNLWSERYDRQLQDIFDVQDEIALSVVDALKVTLLKREKNAVLKRHTENVVAYQLYLKGRFYWWKSAPGDFHKSREFFQRAVEADPNYALGYCGLSSYYGFGSAWGFVPPDVGWPKAIETNRKAKSLDDTLPEVHNDLAGISMVYYRDKAATEREARRAIELNPKFQEIHYLYSFYLLTTGRFEEAIGAARQALELDPLSVRVNHSLAFTYYLARRNEEAINQYQQSLELDEHNPMVHEGLADAHEQAGSYDDAIVHLGKALELTGEADSAALLQRLCEEEGFASAMRGLSEKKLAQLNAAAQAGNYIPAIKFARGYVRSGNMDQALIWLRKACAERNVFALTIHVDPFYDPLRRDRRFTAILDRFDLTAPEQTVRMRAKTEFSGSGSKSPSSSGGRLAAENTLAVLPFKPLIPHERDEALELGMADTLITRLSGRDIIVRPISSVRKFVDLDQDPISAGNQLQVASVLDGTIQRAGDRIRMTVRLISTVNGASLWSGTFEDNFTDIFAVQDAISEKILAALSLPATGLSKRYTENPEAYELYLKGRYHFNRMSPADVQKSLTYLQEAIVIDPSYALAYVGLANAYRGLGIAGDRAAEFLPKSKQAAQRAVELDPMSSDAHAVLGFTIFWFEWNWQRAERELKLALDLNPNNADAHWFYGTLLSSLGRRSEALNEVKRARELDPLNLLISGAEGQFLIHAGRPAESLLRLKKTIALEPNFWFAHMFAADAHAELGDFAAAIDEARRSTEIAPNSHALASLGYALGKSGAATDARQTLDRLLKLARDSHGSAHNVAVVYHGLGDEDEALAWLRLGLEQRDPRMVFLRVEPKWNDLRKHPRFAELITRMEANRLRD